MKDFSNLKIHIITYSFSPDQTLKILNGQNKKKKMKTIQNALKKRPNTEICFDDCFNHFF